VIGFARAFCCPHVKKSWYAGGTDRTKKVIKNYKYSFGNLDYKIKYKEFY